MSYIPRVSELTLERVSREFDDLGPAACVAEMTELLAKQNPELLDMMSRCALDATRPDRVMVGFAMFYRLMLAEARVHDRTSDGGMLPRVSADTREHIVSEIDEEGPDQFTLRACNQLHEDNPALLEMAHNFAERHARGYLPIMQGFCLVYRSIVLQSAVERRRLH